MNVTVECRNSTETVEVAIQMTGEMATVTNKGMQDLLQAWCDGPSRSWAPLGDDLGMRTYAVAWQDDRGQTVLNHVGPVGSNAYSLTQLSSALGQALNWGQGLRQPTPGNQVELEAALIRYLETDGAHFTPSDFDVLRPVIMAVAGAVYCA